MISLVTAKVIRANAQYAYKLKGQGEKYLVEHNDNESASDKIVEYLTPYAVYGCPVQVESVAVQKKSEILIGNHEDCPIFKCCVRGMETDVDGKSRKFQRRYFAQAIDPIEAIAMVQEAFEDTACEYEILSVAKTNIIEIK